MKANVIDTGEQPRAVLSDQGRPKSGTEGLAIHGVLLRRFLPNGPKQPKLLQVCSLVLETKGGRNKTVRR